MYKYSYVKDFDSGCKIVTQIGVAPSLTDSGVAASVAFTSQLTEAQKANLDQVMTDKGYIYADMVQGGVESYLLATSPNGTVWKVCIDDNGVLETNLL